MNINEYFEEVQNCLKNRLQNPNELDTLIKNLKKDNIQAVINKNFNNGLTVEECANDILEMIYIEDDSTSEEPNQIVGDRGMNKLEKKIMNYFNFINETYKK